MNTTVALLITFSATTVATGIILSMFYDAVFRYPVSLQERIQSLSGRAAQSGNSMLLDVRQFADASSNSSADWRSILRTFLAQSGLRSHTNTFVFASLALAAVLGLSTVIAAGNAFVAPAGAIAGLAIPWVYVYLRRRTRLRQMMQQLPHVMDIICRAVKAGQTLPAAFQMVADDFSPPISDEFRACYEQQNLGISYETALRNLARSAGIMELRILIVALLVQSRSGGNLTELLSNLATVTRKRLTLEQKVKALTGEGRLQALVLIALPVVVFGSMYLLNREYAQVLIDRPWLLGGCAMSQAVGAFCIQRIIRIDY